jgi:hypothetical protein
MKKIPQEPAANTATMKGERLIIDISSLQTENAAKNHYWLLTMDAYKNCLWSNFLKQKDKQLPTVNKHKKVTK